MLFLLYVLHVLHVQHHAASKSGIMPEEIVADRMVSISLLGFAMSARLCSPCFSCGGIYSSSAVETLRLVGVKSEECGSDNDGRIGHMGGLRLEGSSMAELWQQCGPQPRRAMSRMDDQRFAAVEVGLHTWKVRHIWSFSRPRNTTISTGMTTAQRQASIDCRRDADLPSFFRQDDAQTWLLQCRVVRFDNDAFRDLRASDKCCTWCMSRKAAMLTTADMAPGKGATCVPRFGGLSSKLPSLSRMATCCTQRKVGSAAIGR
jgi:hypothetical protein